MKKTVSLDDKYINKTGSIYINGIQSLVRLPLIQKQRDLKNKLNTSGFISGYPGSPLGGYDLELIKAKKYYERSLAAKELSSDTKSALNTRINIGILNIDLGYYHHALKIFQETLATASEQDNKFHYALMYF